MENLVEWIAFSLVTYYVISILKEDPLGWFKFFLFCTWRLSLMVAVVGMIVFMFEEIGWAWGVVLLVASQIMVFVVMTWMAR